MTFAAELSKPETWAKSSSTHKRGRVGLEHAIETVADSGGVAEDDVAAQPIDLHPLTPVAEYGAVGGGTGPLAALLAQGEGFVDDTYLAEAHDEEDHGRRETHSHAFQEAYEDDDERDREDDAVIQPRQRLAAGDQHFVEQVEPDEQHETAEHRRREQRQDLAADEQDQADDEPRP